MLLLIFLTHLYIYKINIKIKKYLKFHKKYFVPFYKNY